jgi:hypothetical protein
MRTLLETIKDHDDKMADLKKQNGLLIQSLGLLVDDLIDRDLTLCVGDGYLKQAVAILKNNQWMDSSRLRNYGQVQQGLCDQSVRLKNVVRTITGVEE